MINLYSLRNQKKNNQREPNEVRTSPAQLRAAKDFSELDLPEQLEVEKSDEMNFKIYVKPDEGYYRGGIYRFNLKIPETYPIEPPKLKCESAIQHPNIDKEGNVCLNILREDWKPVLSINEIVLGLLFIFHEPNMDDPLNKEAAEMLRSKGFIRRRIH